MFTIGMQTITIQYGRNLVIYSLFKGCLPKLVIVILYAVHPTLWFTFDMDPI